MIASELQVIRFPAQSMLGYLKNLRSKNTFLPGRAGLFLNPHYLMRRTLAEAIRGVAGGVRGTLLDFGCGARPYESLFGVERYIGLDIEVSGHPPEGKRADIYYDGKHIPMDDASVDHVFSAEVFEHVFNAPELFREIHRVLKPGGTLILTCPFAWPLHEEPYDYARYTPYALESLLGEAGYPTVKATRHGHPAEVICQLALGEIATYPLLGIRAVRAIALPVLTGILNISGRLLSKILPDSGTLYFSNVVVATKSPVVVPQATATEMTSSV